MTTNIAFTYEERQALHVMKKLLKRKPEAAHILFEGMARDSAVNILLGAKKELEDLHTLARAITAASGEIVKMDKEKNDAKATLLENQ